MSQELEGVIRFGYTADGALDVESSRLENVLILNDQADSYLLYLLRSLSKLGLPFELYDVAGHVACSLAGECGLADARNYVSSVLSFDDADSLLSSRVVSEAFKHTLSLSGDEFLLLNSILQTLYKQSSKVNLLQVISSVRSYDSRESSLVERSAASRLDWRLYLVNDLLMHTVSEGAQLPFNGQRIFDLSNVISVEGRSLLLCLLLAKGSLTRVSDGLQAIYLSDCDKQAKARILEYIVFLRSIFPRRRLVFACNPPFPQNRTQMFQTIVVDGKSLTYSSNAATCVQAADVSEGELVFRQGDHMVSFFYDRPDLRKSSKRQKKTSTEDKVVSDIRLAKRILEILSKFENVTKTGIIQSLSIDFPTEMVEFVLEELISLDYVLAEVKKSRTGLTTKLAISMSGRSWLVKGGEEM
ncbi:MAG: hypothetical protein ACUVQ8_00700 [Nitrososphaeria archaeon]